MLPTKQITRNTEVLVLLTKHVLLINDKLVLTETPSSPKDESKPGML